MPTGGSRRTEYRKYQLIVAEHKKKGLEMETNAGWRVVLCVTALLLVATAGQTLAAQDTLVAAGSVWKYLDDGSDQGTAWYRPDFNDSGWASGPAELGYGDGDEATVVSFGPSPNNKYVTTYFRHSFSVPDASIYQKVTLNVKRDDGVVVYLNGKEVFRDNMPTGIITYVTPAASAVEDNSFHSTTIDASNLVSGANVLAVEIHQHGGPSSDISFDLSLEASTEPVPQEQILVAAGSVWKYLDDGSDQGTAWYKPDFNDSGWMSGPAELGYGDGDEATVVSFGPNPNNKYITTYFRHIFSVFDPSKHQNLILRILRDDGAVVYLNGAEVFRTNMPEGMITYTTWALSPVGGPAEDELIETTIDAAYLVAGTNLLAVEVHQNQPNSSDISFDLTLVVTTDGIGPVVTGVRKGPYLIYPGDNTKMQVLWQLKSPESHTLRWGQDPNYSEGSATPEMYGDNQYEHTITGLTPGAKYYYEVKDVGVGSFLAAPPGDAMDVKFLVYGDCRSNPPIHDAVNAGMIATYTIDPAYQTFTMLTGDWVNRGDSESDWTEQFFNRSWLNTIQMQANLPINGCIGNHEDSGRVFNKYWPYPYESGGRYYWSFDYGPAHIVVLDLKTEREGLGEAQRAWLEADLAASTKEWKFLQFHAPVYSAGGVGGGHPNNMIEQAYIQSLCEMYGVSMVFCGHNHYYAHCDVNGVKHITSGGGGAPLNKPNPSYHPSIVTASSTYHFCKIDIHGLQLDFEAVDINGNVIDAFTLYHVDDATAAPRFRGDRLAPAKAGVDLKSTYAAIVD